MKLFEVNVLIDDALVDSYLTKANSVEEVINPLVGSCPRCTERRPEPESSISYRVEEITKQEG